MIWKALQSEDTSFTGKLRLFFPNLYSSLSLWERHHLNSTHSLNLSSSTSDVTNNLLNLDLVFDSAKKVSVVSSESDPLVEKTHQPSIVEPALGSSQAPGYTESELSDSALDNLLTDLIPSGHRLKKPLPLPIFSGTSPVVRKATIGSTFESRDDEHFICRPCMVEGLGVQSISFKKCVVLAGRQELQTTLCLRQQLLLILGRLED
jgi:hypothetical protein